MVMHRPNWKHAQIGCRHHIHVKLQCTVQQYGTGIYVALIIYLVDMTAQTEMFQVRIIRSKEAYWIRISMENADLDSRGKKAKTCSRSESLDERVKVGKDLTKI